MMEGGKWLRFVFRLDLLFVLIWWKVTSPYHTDDHKFDSLYIVHEDALSALDLHRDSKHCVLRSFGGHLLRSKGS